MLIGVVVITLTTNLHLRFIYKDINTLFIHEPKEIKILKRNIVVWERTAASISPFSKDATIVRETLIKKVKILKHDLKKKMAKGGIATARYKSTLEDMEKAYPIKKKGLLIKSVFALTFILVLFLVESFPQIHRLSLGWSALLGVILLLIISNRDDMDAILHRVEFSTLLFFAAMFVLMEAIDRMGFITWIGSGCEDIIKSVSKDYRLAVAIIIIIWVSAITSAFVDSIPVTQMMVKIVISLAARIGLPLQPLVWALAFGPSLGGNGTLIGASANVICAGIAEQHGYKMTFMDFFK
jgi:Na+/H+ antiporter NhaD/arsenite permease-like protein